MRTIGVKAYLVGPGSVVRHDGAVFVVTQVTDMGDTISLLDNDGLARTYGEWDIVECVDVSLREVA